MNETNGIGNDFWSIDSDSEEEIDRKTSRLATNKDIDALMNQMESMWKDLTTCSDMIRNIGRKVFAMDTQMTNYFEDR